jgi:hypothetical protein
VLAGLALARDDRLDAARGFRELLQWYALVLASYPRGQALCLALLRRLEIENVKLAWRAVAHHSGAEWLALWVDFGELASVSLERCRDHRALQALTEALRGTPFASIAGAMWRAHGDDPAAAELGFDRWASQAMVAAAAALPAVDRLAADLARAVVRERDVNVMGRLTGEARPELLALPDEWRRRPLPAADARQWLVRLRHARGRLCRRAFRDSPFCLAPAIALLLLKEEEVRGLEALALFQASAADARSMDFALAGSELGA